MKDQILKLIETEGLTPARFADEIGVQRSSISHIISGRNKPSYDFILKIIQRFSGINTEWLLTGKGSMIKQQIQPENTAKRDLFDQSNPRKPETIKENINSQLPPPTEADYPPSRQGNSKLSTQMKSNTTHNIQNQQVTNVNSVDFILVFYTDGSFKRYNSRD